MILDKLVPPKVYRLYHGTSSASAKELQEHGWSPDRGRSGGQCGQSRYLYLTSRAENAQWYADEKIDGVVLAVDVDASCLEVDPEDGVSGHVADEMSLPGGLPGSLVCTGPIEAAAFREVDGMETEPNI